MFNDFFLYFGPEMGSRRAGRGLKRFLEAVGFILAEFEPKRSHGGPIRDIFRVNVQDAISRNIIAEQHRFFYERIDPPRPLQKDVQRNSAFSGLRNSSPSLF